MVTEILSYRAIQAFISVLIVTVAILSIFTPNLYLFKLGNAYTIQIMLLYLVLGLVFLLFKQPKLTFVSFICCASLCLFLKYSTNAALTAPVPLVNEEVLNVAHFNLSSSSDNPETILEYIHSTGADLISIQELTPDWLALLEENLSGLYPYSSKIVRVDPFGIALFSKTPFENLDTFYYNEIPNLAGSIQTNTSKKTFNFIAAHTTPPLYSKAHSRMQEHLKLLEEHASKLKDEALLTVGDFYAPPWCGEIQELKYAGNFSDSRRTARLNITHLFDNPVDYILHNDHFTCVAFESINNQQGEHIGIQGAYQFTTENPN